MSTSSYWLRLTICLSCLITFASVSLASPSHHAHERHHHHHVRKTPTASQLFKQVVAFGDNFSDNGNGSARMGIAQAGDPHNKIYGNSTWTNGPVAVSYLANILGLKVTEDYAVGHAAGGSKFGATIDNAYTKSEAPISLTGDSNPVPSAKDQVAAYLKSVVKNSAAVKDTLFFLWTGNNDIQPYIGSPSPGDPSWHCSFGETSDSKFNSHMSSLMVGMVEDLVNAGASKIIVPSMYPKHLAPVVERYLTQNADDIKHFGECIQSANAAVKAALDAKYSSHVIHYDVFTHMTDIYNGAPGNGIKYPQTGCDADCAWEGPCSPTNTISDNTAKFDLCLGSPAGSRQFMWVNYLDPMSYIHSWIAGNMSETVQQNLAAS